MYKVETRSRVADMGALQKYEPIPDKPCRRDAPPE
jgi:hypothetical protein